jgi:nucleotide-binding universal stress UspA family protein
MVCYDGLKASQNALEHSKTHARAFNAKIFLVRSLVGGADDREEQLKLIKKAENELEAAKNSLESEGIDCETHLLVRGYSPGEDLVQFAEQIDAHEIIIGVEKKSKVGKFLLGSTAQHVILKSPCPVLSVKYKI